MKKIPTQAEIEIEAENEVKAHNEASIAHIKRELELNRDNANSVLRSISYELSKSYVSQSYIKEKLNYISCRAERIAELNKRLFELEP